MINFFCKLFYDTVSYLDYVVSNGRMTDEWWTGKDLKGSSHAILEFGKNEENYETPQLEKLVSSWNSNQGPFKYE
jgi:hypothetical protein